MSLPATSLLDALLPTPKSAGDGALAAKSAAAGEVARAPSFNAVMAAAIAKAASAGQAIAGQAGAGQVGTGQAFANQAGAGQAGASQTITGQAITGQVGAKLPDASGGDDDASLDAAALLPFAGNGRIAPGTPPTDKRAVASRNVSATPPTADEAPSVHPGAPGLAIATTVAASDIPQAIASGLDPAVVRTSGLTATANAQAPIGPAADNAVPTATPKDAKDASKDTPKAVQAPAPPMNTAETRPAAGPQGSGPGGAPAAVILVADGAPNAAPATLQTPPATLSGESAIVVNEAARGAKPDSAETARGARAKSRATPTATPPTQATAAATPEATANMASDADADASGARTAAVVTFADLARREAARGGAGEDKPDGASQAGPLVAGTRNATIQHDAGARGAAEAKAPPLPTPPVVDQVIVHLRTALDQGIDRLDIRLKPASLGHITMKLDVSGNGHVTAVITADRPDTLNMLQRDARGLERALHDAGLQTNQGSLDFNLRGDGRFAGQQGGSGGFAGYGGDHPSGALAGPREAAPAEIQAAAATNAPRGPSTRALDIEV